MSDETPGPTQAQIDNLMAVIDRFEKRRRIMLAGYLISLVVLCGGQIVALWIYSRMPPGSFIAWIFMIPFAVVGGVLWLFGRLSRPKPQSRG